MAEPGTQAVQNRTPLKAGQSADLRAGLGASLMASLGAVAAFFRQRWPLSVFGTLLLGGSIALLTASIVHSDSLAAASGVLGLLFALVPMLVLMLLPPPSLADELQWNTSRPLRAGTGQKGLPLALGGEIPAFLRLDVHIRGSLELGEGFRKRTLYRYRQHCRFTGAGEIAIPVHPPLSGALALRADIVLSDSFGIGRRYLGSICDRQCPVLPLSEPMADHPEIIHSESQDDHSLRRPKDSEKIFIRDYQPGDLARDINWKASSRLDSLLTRIPPEAESPAPLIRMMLIAGMVENLEDASYLSYSKDLLAGFLEQAFREDRGLTFEVSLQDQLHRIDESGDLEEFLPRLSAWMPRADREYPLPAEDGAPPLLFSHQGCVDLEQVISGYSGELQLFLVRQWQAGDYHRLQRLLPGSGFYPAMKPGHRQTAAGYSRRQGNSALRRSGVKLHEYYLRIEW